MNSSSQLPFDFTLQESFTFDDFVIAENNNELISILKYKQDLTDQCYFIWGIQGVGKSHLLQAFCQTRENSVYISLKKFAEYGPEILMGLENMEIICLDDLESIAGSRHWEEGLFEFFNTIREQDKKLIMSASTAPRNLKLDLADLGSRLSWGVIYQLHELADDEKAEALRQRAHGRGITLNKEVLAYILQRSSRNMHSLFGVLDTLDHLSLTEKRRITIPFVKNILNW